MSRFDPPVFRTAPQRILIIKPSAIGDVVHGLPILNLLRKKWPQAQISWLITPACAGLLEGHPDIHELIHFDRKGFAKSWRNFKVARALFQFGQLLRERKFDLVIDLQGLFRSGWLAWQTGAPIRISSTSAREFADRFCTHVAKIDPREQHAIDRYLTIAEFLGLGKSPIKFQFATSDSDRQFVRSLLPTNVKFAVLVPTTNWLTKRWPLQNFAALIKPLKDQFGLSPVIAGGPDVAEMSSLFPGAINLGGKTNLRQLVALIESASLIISGDTGPMHIAAALDKPMVSLFGPTSPIRTGPYHRLDSVLKIDIPCSPCYSRNCSHHSCLKWLGLAPVLELAEKQLQKSPDDSRPGLRLSVL